MARRKLSRADEQAAIVDAERIRDDIEAPLKRADLGRAVPSVVLSVRLPIETAEAFRALASERRQSLSELLSKAVTNFVCQNGPDFTVSRTLSQLILYHGAEPARLKDQWEADLSIQLERSEASVTASALVGAGS